MGILVLNSTGQRDGTGYMGNRVVGPATPTVYKDNILTPWSTQDTRYRCFMLDAAVNYYGKFVEMVQAGSVNTGYTLVGEAIPQDEDARKTAVWFGMAGLPSGPWWTNRQVDDGYNFGWATNWDQTPLYFGVQAGEYLSLTGTDIDKSGGSGNNLTISAIYMRTLKGATPVAWYGPTYQVVGAAWNYAMGLVASSRHARCPRLLRSARC